MTGFDVNITVTGNCLCRHCTKLLRFGDKQRRATCHHVMCTNRESADRFDLTKDLTLLDFQVDFYCSILSVHYFRDRESFWLVITI
jgi:hypothetical protein